jgi:hypothetical protein
MYIVYTQVHTYSFFRKISWRYKGTNTYRANPKTSSYNARVSIQKPVVTDDLRKFSVTSRARLPNYLKINLKI